MLQEFTEELNRAQQHFTVLTAIISHEPIGILALEEKTDIEHYEIRFSLRVLQEEGVIKPTSNGAVLTTDAHQHIQDLNNDMETVAEQFNDFQSVLTKTQAELE
ncbi:hypothetical protein [Salinibaculum rarum]|uniref:hypothetical protein n=1 Tax=Salinibaculum rarum TaxID=3058903 RepID=UPI00265E9A8E|nr:hypothetical protein [Salinibaculum sp. KK48]